jgi:hypothetical protein
LFGVSPDPSRRMMIASIGNSINNVVIERQAGHVPWNEPIYIVITSDHELAAEIEGTLVGAGVSSSDIFIEPVSPDLVRLGLRRSADDLITYIRYAMPEDVTAGEQWRRTLPLTILRVRDVNAERRYDSPIPVPEYAKREANFDEKVLATDLGNLVGAVRTSWGQPEAQLVPFFSAYKVLDLVGQHCLGHPVETRGPMDCLGDSQDADYQISASGSIDDGRVVAVVGTLSQQTGNATYTSLSVNWFPRLVGIANIDDAALLGTAASFAGALQHEHRLFYVYYVARDCTGLTNCVAVPTSAVPRGEVIKLIQRNYVKPGSTTGPDPDYVLNPVGIVLERG